MSSEGTITFDPNAWTPSGDLTYPFLTDMIGAAFLISLFLAIYLHWV
jgi:hypothetical protein